MIEVRVSEETPNLSHPSNLNSAVRLENYSPSLMRLIKASGRTHSWVRERSERNLGERPRGSWWDAKSKRKMMQQQSCWESKSSWWDAKNKEVEAFLLREQEELKHSCWENKRRARERLSWEKRQHLPKERTHPKAKRSTDFRQQGRTGRTVRICGGHTACDVHRNWKETAAAISGSIC